MELASLLNGFVQALTPMNLLVCAAGVLVGTLVGVLPGLGPASAIAILLPLTVVLEPAQSIIMLAGIYYGSQYGGSTTAILMNIPGEASSVVTCIDGYPMAKQGKGGKALGIAAIGSFIAGLLGVVGLTFFAPVFAEYSLSFGPPEYFALMLLSISIVINFTGQSMVKGLIVGLLGLLLSCVGMSPISGKSRFTLGIPALDNGFETVAIIIGLIAMKEVILGLESGQESVAMSKVSNVYPTLADLKRCIGSIFRGGIIGFVLGLLPGCTPTVASFLSYDVERKLSKHPEEFGHGAIEAVAGPESANNANSSAAFIPLFSFGIPCTATMAMLLVGLQMYGVQPGPLLFTSSDGFIWTVIASMFIGNVMLLLLNLPLVGIWAKLTQVPYGIMGPSILLLCVVGSYTLRYRLFDVITMLAFGVLGYFLSKHNWPTVPLILMFILGSQMENSFLQSMGMSGDNLLIFFTRPISCVLIIATVVLTFVSVRLMLRTKKRMQEATGDADFLDEG